MVARGLNQFLLHNSIIILNIVSRLPSNVINVTENVTSRHILEFNDYKPQRATR